MGYPINLSSLILSFLPFANWRRREGDWTRQATGLTLCAFGESSLSEDQVHERRAGPWQPGRSR